jgi:hypothetical protein
MLQIAGLFDQFTAAVTLEYLDLLLRVGFAGFVFANVETLAAEAEDRSDGNAAEAGQHATPASGTGAD